MFYPMWLVSDNVFYAAFSEPSLMSVALAVVVFVTLVGITIAFAFIGQPLAAHRADRMGVSREAYLKRQKRWAVGCAIAGAAMIALATYYNLAIRPTIGV